MNQNTVSRLQSSSQQNERVSLIRVGYVFLKYAVKNAAFLLFISGLTVITTADDSARINGAADFLSRRANENSLHIFYRAMKNHPYIQQFMPNTCSRLKSSDLRSLLLSDGLEWKNSVENDLVNFQILLLKALQSNFDTAIFDIYSSLTDSLPGAFEGVEVRAEGDSCSCHLAYPVDQCTCSSPRTREISSSARLSILGFFKISFEYTTIAQLSSKFKEFRLGDITDINQTSSFSNALKEIRTDRFISISDSVQKWRKYLIGDTSSLYLVDMMATFYCRLDSALDCAVKMTDTNESFESRVNNTLFVTGFINQILGDAMDLSSSVFTDYRRYVLFFARVADAKSESEVKAVLNGVILPEASFQNKKEYQGLSLSVSSYMGVTAGIESGNGTYKRNWSAKTAGRYLYGGLTTPLGIELSKGWACGWSTGLLLPIIDIGPAVNTVLFNGNGDHLDKLNWIDLLVPGVCLTAGIKDYPVAIGAGWYKGKSLHTDRYPEHHLFCFVGFDMSLFSWRL
jgi:hypothetical protein